MADTLYNNVLLKGASGLPIYPQTLMDNVFVTVGTDGTVTNQQTLREWLAANYVGLSIQVVLSTSEITDPKANIIYFVPQDDAEAGGYVEYIYILATADKEAHFEAIGSTDLDLSDYVTLTELTTTLAGYQPKGDYALASALDSYYTKTESDGRFQPKGDYQPSGDYALASALNNYYTKTESGNLFQPKGDYALATALADYYTKTEALSQFIDSSELSEALAAYVTSASLLSTLTSYVTTDSLTNTLASYTTLSELQSTLLSYLTQETANNTYVKQLDITQAALLGVQEAGAHAYAAGLANITGSYWLLNGASQLLLLAMTQNGQNADYPILQKIVDTIITVSGDGTTTQDQGNWLDNALQLMGYLAVRSTGEVEGNLTAVVTQLGTAVQLCTSDGANDATVDLAYAYIESIDAVAAHRLNDVTPDDDYDQETPVLLASILYSFMRRAGFKKEALITALLEAALTSYYTKTLADAKFITYDIILETTLA